MGAQRLVGDRGIVVRSAVTQLCKTVESWCLFVVFRATWSFLIALLGYDQTMSSKSGVNGRPQRAVDLKWRSRTAGAEDV